MQTVSADKFKQMYGEEAANAFTPQSTNTPASQEPGYLSRVIDRVSSDISNRVDRVGQIEKSDASTPEKGLQYFGQGAGLAASTLETVVFETPGIKQGVQAIGAGIQWLANSDLSPIKHLGDVIGSSKTIQEITNLYDTDQSFHDTVDAVANTVRLGGDITTIDNSANFATNVTNKVIRNIKNRVPTTDVTPPPPSSSASAIIGETRGKVATNIMNRVARLNPSDAKRFEQIAGKSHGQYLVDTGNFGTPEKIITNEAVKFTNSYNAVDDTLARLPGVYKNGAITDALNGLLQKAETISSESVKAPYLAQVKSLIAKNNGVGLTMEEINTVKRLFERNVKLGYNKLLNADKVEQATNIDSAIRAWQFSTAKKLGFKNLDALNKQTQISRFIVNKLGEQLVGKSGLNNVNLTDWIVLSGGNPTAVAGFLAKRFFSSKTVQARVAQFLNQKPADIPIVPDVQPTVESGIRSAFPSGTRPELPAGGVPRTSSVSTPLITPVSNSTEAAAISSSKTSFNPKTGDQYVRNLKTGKLEIIPAKPSTRPQPQTAKGTTYQDGTPIPPELQPLAKEAQKYSSAEEFVKAQIPVYRGVNAGEVVFAPSEKGAFKELGFSVSADRKIASSYGTKTLTGYVAPDAKIADLGQIPDIAKIEEAKANGYDAASFVNKSGEAETLVFNKNIVQTKSQLTDFYNKVKKE